jgi:aminoglycoside phosphotransferase (APT) family kinase protein
VNAVYRVRLPDGSDAALKTPLLPTDAEFLAEPRVLNRIGRETRVPVPAVLATARADEGPLPGAYFLTRYCEGRGVADLLTLSDAAQERLLREAGRNLEAIHAVRPVDGFGDLRVVGGDLAVRPGTATWADRFGELAADAADGLVGDARVADPEPRFADLASDVRAAFDGFPPAEGRDVAPAVLHEDYRPANLTLAPDDVSPLTRAVLDFGDCSTGDGLLDLAHA